MAITFRKDLQALVTDILRAGYVIHSVEQTTDARGRDIEVRLSNGVVVNWDPQSKSIWAEGPRLASEKAEAYLRRVYEGGALARIWVNPAAVLGVAAVLIIAAFLLVSRLFKW